MKTGCPDQRQPVLRGAKRLAKAPRSEPRQGKRLNVCLPIPHNPVNAVGPSPGQKTGRMKHAQCITLVL
jgi:hypothetical protein